jgi:hypothetical protein
MVCTRFTTHDVAPDHRPHHDIEIENSGDITVAPYSRGKTHSSVGRAGSEVALRYAENFGA